MQVAPFKSLSRLRLARRPFRISSRSFSFSTAKALVHEVTPRDGLQNENVVLSIQDKLQLVRNLIRAKPNSIELASFVRPDLVPAMADGVELCKRLNEEPWALEAKRRGMSFAALVPNMRGYEALAGLVEAGPDKSVLDTAVVLVSATESHSQANVRRPIKEALDTACEIIARAKQDGIRSQAYVSLAFGCPFEGDVDPKVVQDIVGTYVDAGADVVMLADTLGVAYPQQVEEVVSNALKIVPVDRLGLHMHDSAGRAQINIHAAALLGVRRFDAAVGGTGGCNFAPGAKGNVSTQGLLQVLDYMGIPHGMDLGVIEETQEHLERALQRKLISKLEAFDPEQHGAAESTHK